MAREDGAGCSFGVGGITFAVIVPQTSVGARNLDYGGIDAAQVRARPTP